MKYVLALDQGTTSSRAILFDESGRKVTTAQKEFEQLFPKPGWVEHHPEDIWATQIGVATEAIGRSRIRMEDVSAIGITNQRETAIVWNRETGEPVYNAIVWQDRRTSGMIDQLVKEGARDMIVSKTGLVPDAYFSATKIAWILDHVKGARQLAESGKLAFGTVDSWLLYRMTERTLHATDFSNASRTMLFNIHTCDWDEELLELFKVPRCMMPEVKPSSGFFAETTGSFAFGSTPITGVAGDQQAALFGQLCTSPGMAKNTYGTGCFMLVNTGNEPVTSQHNLVTTVAWDLERKPVYALEGSVFICGAVVQWLRDGLGLIRTASEVEKLAATEKDNGGVYLVPAFAGLGAPHWDQYARGIMCGITRGVTAGHIARAALEGIAYQVSDLYEAMKRDAQIPIEELRADGGASQNNLLLQLQADFLQIPVVRPKEVETTALGAAYLAGLGAGIWKSTDQLQNQWEVDRRFEPQMNPEGVLAMKEGWKKALERSKSWADE